jgi:CubicO group peptidase (beta-lactamase class C family)
VAQRRRVGGQRVGQDPDRILRDYVAHEIRPLASALRVEVDREQGVVETSSLGLVGARAIHREGLGCTLVADATEEELRAWTGRFGPRPSLPRDLPWPEGGAGVQAPPPPAVTAALERAFSEPAPEGDPPRRQTTAVVVAHRGRLVAERYAPGYGPETPMLSWSMAKSVIASLVAIAVGDGELVLQDPAPVPEWSQAADPRGAITLDQLLRMSSGLAFDETYGATNDVSRMLFTRGDTGAFAAAMALAYEPDHVWSYSSGTSNLVSRILRDLFEGDLARLVSFSRQRLFDPIGMSSAFFEPDASGSFIGSSFFFASARDWARFGQLHLQDGIWQGRRILPEGWVRYVTTPTPAAPNGIYGAHWWLNAGDPQTPERRMWPTLPREIYAARGHSGQYVVVAPSAQLVVVRLGLTRGDDDELQGIEPLVAALLDWYSPRATPDRD